MSGIRGPRTRLCLRPQPRLLLRVGLKSREMHTGLCVPLGRSHCSERGERRWGIVLPGSVGSLGSVPVVEFGGVCFSLTCKASDTGHYLGSPAGPGWS